MPTPRKPTAIKILEGNPGKRPLNKNEPQPRNNIPECPDWLSTDAKDVWFRLASDMHRSGVLTILDGDALACYCMAYARWKKAELFLEKTGSDTYPKKDGNGKIKCMMPWPQVNIAAKYLGLMHKFMREFGLTPSSRSNLATSLIDGEENPWNKYLRK